MQKKKKMYIFKISFEFGQNRILTNHQNHENQKTLSFIASKISSSLDCIILWYCANNPLFYLLIVKKAANFIACFCQCLCPSSVCLLPPPLSWIQKGFARFAKGGLQEWACRILSLRPEERCYISKAFPILNSQRGREGPGQEIKPVQEVKAFWPV